MIFSNQVRAFVCALLVATLTGCPGSKPQQSTGTVRVVWPKDPESLCPVTLPNSYAVQSINLLYQGLLAIDAASRSRVPCLAEAMPRETRDDSLTYLQYRLNPAATWDNGKPVLASDVAFTLKAHFAPGIPNEGQRAIIDFIQDIRLDAKDPRAFTLVCRGHAATHAINSGEFSVLPEYLLDPTGVLRAVPVRSFTRPVPNLEQLPAVLAFQKAFNEASRWRDPQQLRGSGPYELVSWNNGQQLTLARKAHWWGSQQSHPVFEANPSRIEFHIVPNAATAILALRRGELDVYPMISGPDFARLQQSADSTRFRFYSPPSFRVVVMETNTQHPKLRNALVRQAMGHLIDVDQLVRAVTFGRGRRTTGIINPLERWAYNDSLPLRSYAPARAAELLQQAGWQRRADGWHLPGQAQPVSLRVAYGAGERTYETIALLFQQAARQIGLEVALAPTEGGLLSEQRRNGEFELALRTLYGNPFFYDLRPLLHSDFVGEHGANRTRFSNRRADQLMESIVATGDSTSQARQLRQLQALLYDQAPYLPLFFEPFRVVVGKRLDNARPTGLEPGFAVGSLRAAAEAGGR
ncbi:ABC transporter substrate-binding protein [Hymenobacter jeollabukensis]|uniref:ABC transporter substrate-binding protein n=1 Tax=Hymenobacter jeollabukensis TaxID=2025313 RepID=A0A5R8WIX5_9BACT|nr:ABC transporter substrate-binding protein [Hymenobacter jeollabukensis]TLM88700.1 ABC transporter substrate-binding protein [Hymenobacter jeollabukensis]